MSDDAITLLHWSTAWRESFLQAAFLKHTELFGDADLPEAAKRMRDTGSCWANN